MKNPHMKLLLIVLCGFFILSNNVKAFVYYKEVNLTNLNGIRIGRESGVRYGAYFGSSTTTISDAQNIGVQVWKVGTPTDCLVLSYRIIDTTLGATRPFIESDPVCASDIPTGLSGLLAGYTVFQFPEPFQIMMNYNARAGFFLQRTGAVDTNNYYEVNFTTTKIDRSYENKAVLCTTPFFEQCTGMASSSIMVMKVSSGSSSEFSVVNDFSNASVEIATSTIEHGFFPLNLFLGFILALLVAFFIIWVFRRPN